ncbi:histone methyltransferase [Mycena belliarum]|uniref:Histone-lysine N-methyltransferase, H3 lysine-36 specific n=1 Tax=Mycena belliarum TaxID=1033014 RepID=A0AAD6TWH8_9AGAR|nr:histone methyltransferase [Mycena belliae]
MPLPDDDSAPSSASSAGSDSPSPTPPPETPLTPALSTKKKSVPPVQLIGDLPIARDDALGTFTEIAGNNYQNKSIGRSREATEDMRCECTYERGGAAPPHVACGPSSNCINRLTQVECLPGDCRCRASCQNQRFQRREYADIEIVLTEKKGYGLRAERDLPKDTFIYEYVGDVVNPVSFKKRMRDYVEEGIQHFYFMMLQKDEFIDATKSGGIGRFANHSCAPNCYVAKWTIGEHVRMGIFARRDIAMHEELTFNYNVDRYGHKAQKCYCGESKCVGYIGGKTQTDLATVDDLYLDALGITDADEVRVLKGTKKTKGKKLDDPDFLPEMRPITAAEVAKIMLAVRQTSNREMMVKLLTRFRLTDNESVMREMLRLRCLGLMKNVLDDYASDSEVVALVCASDSVLQSILPWPLAVRNKVDDSHIEDSVKPFAESVDEKLRALAQPILDRWGALTSGYRIPKRIITEEEKEREKEKEREREREKQKSRRTRVSRTSIGQPPTSIRRPTSFFPYDYVPPPEPPKPIPQVFRSTYDPDAEQKAVAGVIAAAVAQKAAADAAAAEAAAKAKLAPAPREHKRKHRSSKPAQTPEEKEANKEKRLLKLVGAVVVKCMSKYGKSLQRDTFKRHAKELIADKERKSSSYADNKLEALSDEKVAKIKKFAKEYIVKVVRKAEKTSKTRASSSSASGAQGTPSIDTPNSIDGVDTVMTEMTVEEAMDMDPATESEDEREGGVEMDVEETSERVADPSPTDIPEDPAASAPPRSASDPRRRPPDDPACAWDPHERMDKQNGHSIVA